MQGISDARDANEISEVLYAELCRRIDKISERGKTGRKECEFMRLLTQIGLAETSEKLEDISVTEYAKMWRRLGVSLADGIMVAN